MMQKTKKKRRPGRPSLSPSEIAAARASILTAAAVVYDRTGVDTHLDAILDQAEVSRATFYKYFETKEAMQEALLERAVTTMLDAIEVAFGSAPGTWQGVKSGVSTFLAFHTAQPGLYRALVASAMDPGSTLYAVRMRGRERFAILFAESVVAAGGAARSMFVYRALAGALEAVSFQILEGQAAVDPQDVAEADALMLRLLWSVLGTEEEPPPPLPPAVAGC